MKTEIKRFSIRNVGSPDLYMKGHQHLNSILLLRNQENVAPDKVREFFVNCFTAIDEKFFDVFDLTVKPFKEISIQSYYTSDDFSRCVNLYPAVFYKGIDQKTFVNFLKRHGVYFEFSLAHLYILCKDHFAELSDWGGRNTLLTKGKDGALYWVNFAINSGDDWPPSEEYYELYLTKFQNSDFQGYEWPFFLATPTLFAKSILTAKITTF